jgi:hypothetical protein
MEWRRLRALLLRGRVITVRNGVHPLRAIFSQANMDPKSAAG